MSFNYEEFDSCSGNKTEYENRDPNFISGQSADASERVVPKLAL